MSTPAVLYDGLTPGLEIAAVSVQVARRASYVQVPNKLDESWPETAGGTVTCRINAEGITNTIWVSTLYARQDARQPADYMVALIDGDIHSGKFVVEEMVETGRTDDGRRRFRLVLLSHGRILYQAAP